MPWWPAARQRSLAAATSGSSASARSYPVDRHPFRNRHARTWPVQGIDLPERQREVFDVYRGDLDARQIRSGGVIPDEKDRPAGERPFEFPDVIGRDGGL